MLRNAGSTAATTGEHTAAGGADQRPDMTMAFLLGHKHPRDCWMSDLIRQTSGGQNGPASPTTDLPPPPEQVPPRLNERLQQAVRWGFQEREFASFEAALPRRATFGEYLAWSRERSGLTPEELGGRADMSPDEIGDLERDRISPLAVDPDKMARLGRALDASIWTMLERIRPSVNGKASPASAMLLREAASPDADSVWSSDGLRAREPFERASIRRVETQTTQCDDWGSYRRAVYQAWRDRKHG